MIFRQHNLPTNILEKLTLKLEYLKDKTFEVFNIEVPEYIVKINIKTYRTFGQIIYSYNNDINFTMRLHEKLLIKCTDLYIENTVIHEYAHIVTRLIYGTTVKPHGKEWKKVAVALGLKNPSARNSIYNNYINLSTDYIYFCNCDNKVHYLSKIKHNKIQRAIKYKLTVPYICKECKKHLKER